MSDKSPTPSYYQRRIGGVLLDPYRIERAYGGLPAPLFSALKKILAAGQRGAKNAEQDIGEAIDALLRWQEMEREDVFGNEVVELEPDRERILPPDYATNVETMLREVFSMGGGESEGERPKKTLFVTTPGAEAGPTWKDRFMALPNQPEGVLKAEHSLHLAPEHATMPDEVERYKAEKESIAVDNAEDTAPEDVCRRALFEVGTLLGFREGEHVVDEAARVAARITELKRELVLVRDEVSAQKLRGEAAEFSLTRVRNESSAQRERAEKAERERDEWEKRSRGAEADLSEFVRQKQEAVKERDRLDRVARSWHDIADKAGDRIGELERERDEQAARADAAEKERDTWRDTAANVAGSREKLRAALDAERRQAVATAEELERVRAELAALREHQPPAPEREESR